MPSNTGLLDPEAQIGLTGQEPVFPQIVWDGFGVLWPEKLGIPAVLGQWGAVSTWCRGLTVVSFGPLVDPEVGAGLSDGMT